MKISYLIKIAFVIFLLSLNMTKICDASSKNSADDRIRIPPKIVYGDPSNRLVRIPPPDEYFNKSSQSMKVIVTYHNFPSAAMVAFQYAVDIWSKLLTSDQPIYMNAYWSSLSTGVLGSCGPTNYFRNSEGMPAQNVFYPLPLAEKLAGRELNAPGEPDIIGYFSSNANWYYGTDGQTPAGKYDLTTVVLHELCHGLGYIGSFSVDDGLGSWGWGTNIPFAFDLFLEDIWGNKLVDTANYVNPSVGLKNAVAGARLFFKGPVLNNFVGKRVTMYTPSTWDDGSSVYHVNPLYVTDDDRLMSPSINAQTSIHNPGKIAVAMLGDMGWMNLKINHEHLISSEKIADVAVDVEFISDFSTEFMNPLLHYSIDSAEYASVPFNSRANFQNGFRAIIPVSKPGKISYYITVQDSYERTFKKPFSAPDYSYSFVIGPDTTPPAIKHFPSKFLMPGQDSISISATVDDLFGIDTAYIEYFVNLDAKPAIGLGLIDENKYRNSIMLSQFNLQTNDSIRYRIVAKDRSLSGNLSYFPDSGYVTLVLEPIPDYIPHIGFDFDVDGNEFILQGFEVSIPNGFENGALHTKHPYEFAGENNSLEYIAQLRFPIKISEKNPFISFDEIVLVEPGEPGTVYGDDEFWDYVIVEGSKDHGKSWQPFKPAWDSRRNKQWETLYRQSEVNQFSRGIGTPDLYQNHLINMLETNKFAAGDTVIVRFRLFSDPFAYGWGWAIDNLKIQTPGLNNRNTIIPKQLVLYPNPADQGVFRIRSYDRFDGAILSVYNTRGQKVYEMNNMAHDDLVDVSNLQKGLYLVMVKTNYAVYSMKLILK